MERTTIMLPDELHERIAQAAKQQGISMGEFIRRSVAREAALGYDTGNGSDGFWGAPATFASGQSDLALRHDDELYGPVRPAPARTG